MDNEVKEFLAALQKKLVSIDYIKTEDIPNIGLYMDQVTTFMDEQLEACKTPRVPKFTVKIGLTFVFFAHFINSFVPNSFVSIDLHARSSLCGLFSLAPTPSSQWYAETKLPPG